MCTMINKLDEKIANFLNQIEHDNTEKYDLLQQLRAFVFHAFTNVTETFKYGGIMLSLNKEFGGLFVYEKHISFEFTFGYQLLTELPLEGKGKYRRHLKFREVSDINEEGLKGLFEQIKKVVG